MKKHRIAGSLNQKKGEIEYKGHLHITGGVTGRMRVRALGNIFVQGSVEGASLLAGGNIHIGANITGAGRSIIHAGGYVSAGGISNANIICGGNLFARERIEDSNIRIDGQVCANCSILRDCKVSAFQGVLLNSIECSCRGATIIDVGTSFRLGDEAKKIKDRLEHKEHELQHLLNALGPMLQKALRDREYARKRGADIDTEVSRSHAFQAQISEIRSEYENTIDLSHQNGVLCVCAQKSIQTGTTIKTASAAFMCKENISGPISFIGNYEKNCIIKEEGVLLQQLKPTFDE